MKKSLRVKYIIGSMIIVGLLCNILSFAAVAADSLTVSESNDRAQENINLLKTRFLQNGVKLLNNPIKGIGYSDAAYMYGTEAQEEKIQLKENIVGTAALLKYFSVNQEDSEASNWAENHLWGDGVKTLYHSTAPKGFSSNEQIQDEKPSRFFAADQFMFFEFAAESFKIGDSSEMENYMNDMYNNLDAFKATANISLHNIADAGAYWTCIENGAKFTSLCYDDVQNPFPEDNTYPLTNISLWAAAGIANYEKAVGTRAGEIDQDVVQVAEEAMQYAERYTWNIELGLFHEEQSLNDTRAFTVNTQAIALLAYARLYDLTGKQIYLSKADILIDSILKYFWIPSMGGVVQYYSPTEQYINSNFTGYDNSLLAYSLIQLGIVTGAEDDSFGQFLTFSKPTSNYMRLGLEIMNFMQNYLWKATTTMAGYIEWINLDGIEILPDSNYDANTRATITNMLAFYNLGATLIQNQSWWVWNMWYLIYVGAALIVIIVIVIIVNRKRNAGNKIPKVVRGLLGDED